MPAQIVERKVMPRDIGAEAVSSNVTWHDTSRASDLQRLC